MEPSIKSGWRPDKPDFRDRKYKTEAKEYQFPSIFSLRNDMPPIMDQGDLGSCTACCISTVLMFNRMKTKQTPYFRPSVLFIYYNERVVENEVNSDSGAEIRTGIKTVNKIGFCDEKYWKYDQKKWKTKPSDRAYKNASLYKTHSYFRLNNKNLTELKACLYSGYPFVFGYTCYDNETEADENGGYIPMPLTTSKTTDGHAMTCCGYDDERKLFIIHNSWGTETGDKGYYYFPYDYMLNTDLTDDLWTVRSINETDNI